MKDVIGNWPQNLLEDIGVEPEDELDRLGEVGNLEVAMALSSLTEREKAAIRLRYMDEMSMREVAERIGLSPERCRQIISKGVRKLRHPRVSIILKKGIQAYIQRRVDAEVKEIVEAREAEIEAVYQAKLAEIAGSAERAAEYLNMSKVAQLETMKVEELDLTVRAYNCLKRAGCNVVADVIDKYPTMDDAMRIRNLGAKSLHEISGKLKTLGVEWPKD